MGGAAPRATGPGPGPGPGLWRASGPLLPLRLPLLLLLLLISAAAVSASASSAPRKPVILELAVPAVADVRDPVTLRCRFDLAGGGLYSVKWYKDDEEFFRFMPDERPPGQTFPVPAVALDESLSGEDHVTLSRLSFNSSGAYRCEVSVEAPSFDTAHQSANMTVMALPRSPPRVEGVREAYSLGEWVRANCTSDRSSPPARLDWFINGAQADRWLMDQMPAEEELASRDSVYVPSMGVKAWLETRAPRSHSVDELGLTTSSLGLLFVAERRFFQGQPPRFELRCVAAVGQRSWAAAASARLAAAANQQLRSASASARLNSAHLMASHAGAAPALLASALLRLLAS